MGGSIHSKGNSNRSAEYNFHVDPEAAHIVLHSAKILNQAAVVASAAADGSSSTSSSASAPILIKLATWESTVDHAFSWSFFDNLTSDSTTTSATLPASTTTQSKLSLFLKGYVQTARQIMESGSPSNNLGFLMCDFYSCAMAINESKCVIEHRDMDGIVECGGGQARGAVFYDWYEWAAQHVKNVRCAIKLNREFMEELLLSTFLQ